MALGAATSYKEPDELTAGIAMTGAGVLRRHGVTAHVVVFAIALAAGLAPWGLLQSGTLPVYLGVGLVLGVMAITAALRAERRLPWLCDPLVLLWALLAQFCVVGPISMVVFDFYAFAPLAPAKMVSVLALYAVLVAAIFLGYQSRIGTILAGRLPGFSGGRRLPASWGVAGLVIASVAACIWYIAAQGGLNAIFGRAYGTVGGVALFQLAFHALLAASLVLGWRAFGAERRRWRVLGVLAVLLAFDAVFFGVVVGARKFMFYLYFGLLAVWLLRWGIARLPKIRVAVIMAFLLAFFAVWGTVRSRPLAEIVSGGNPDQIGTATGGYHMGFFRSVAEPFEVAGVVLDLFPEQERYRFGGTMLVTLLGFIPRAVWPDKPVGIGKELTYYTDGVYYDPRSGHSVAPTILGDFYANMGVAGVFFGGIFLGIVARAAAAYAMEGMVGGQQRSAARVLLPAVFLASLAEVRGDLGAILAFCVMTAVPIVAVLLSCRLDHDDALEPELEEAGAEQLA